MARRSSGNDQAISLFPFLSILVCVIGVLMLMIAGSSLGEMGKEPDQEAVARTTEYRKLKEQLSVDETEVSDLQDDFELMAPEREKLENVKKELEQLEQKKKEIDSQSAKRQKLLALERQIELLKKRIAELEAELKMRNESIVELDKMIDEKGKPPEAVVSIRPGGSGSNQDPTFVECTNSGIVIFEGDEEKRVRLADLSVDPNYLSILDRVSKDKNGILIFLLRDDATNTYNAARNVALDRGIKNGKLPVIGHGKIDLSYVDRAKRRNKGKD